MKGFSGCVGFRGMKLSAVNGSDVSDLLAGGGSLWRRLSLVGTG